MVMTMIMMEKAMLASVMGIIWVVSLTTVV
jgi:hypothetical protein